ncbi:MAG: hypothetical protein OXC91_07210 [Rhodobacteraceae bacterium]|nr:hypothetical protein [Paracoccaceae bacterium]
MKGSLAGFRSIDVSRNWRIIFRFSGVHACDLDPIDYRQEDKDMAMKTPLHPGLSVRHDR